MKSEEQNGAEQGAVLSPDAAAPGSVNVDDEAIKIKLQELLAEADLQTTTEKKLRKALEEHFGCDLTSKKGLVRSEVDAWLAKMNEEEDEEEEEEEEEEKKKPKRGRSQSHLGSVLSPELQALVGQKAMPRPQVVKFIWAYIKEHNLQDPKNKRNIILDDKLKTIFKPPVNIFSMNKQLSKHCKINDKGSDDDGSEGGSASEDEEEEARPKKRAAKAAPRKKASGGGGGGGGFTKPVKLSSELSAFFGGVPALSRSDLTKKFWEYFKENGLQDPKNKQNILCDDRLKKLLGVSSFHAFGIQKHLAKHIVKD